MLAAIDDVGLGHGRAPELDQGALDEVQARFTSNERPAEELYDLQEDPDEIRNLVHSPKRAHALELAREHPDWRLNTANVSSDSATT